MDSAEGPVINCIMLVTWPERQQMTQEALVSFICQDYANRVLTIVNDGAPCRLTSAFHARCRGQVLQVPPGTTIGEKRNAGAQAVAADYLASFDDDDFSLPGRLSDHLACIGNAVWLSAGRKYIALHRLDNIIGFEYGRCFGAGMISAEVTRRLSWPALNWCGDREPHTASARHLHADICTAYALRTCCMRAACALRADTCVHALPACARPSGVRTSGCTRPRGRTPSSAAGRRLGLGRRRAPMAASSRQSSSTTFTGGTRVSTAPSRVAPRPAPRAHRSPSPSVTPAHPSPQPPAAASTGSYAAPTWHWGGAGPPPGRPLEAAARLASWCWPLSTARRHETNASVAHRQSLWQGVVPLQLAGGAAVAAPAQVASLLQLHAGEVYLEAAVDEVVAEA